LQAAPDVRDAWGPPLAVGRMAVDADQIDRGVTKGKAVVVLHTWKDHLWSIGSKGEPLEAMPVSVAAGEGEGEARSPSGILSPRWAMVPSRNPRRNSRQRVTSSASVYLSGSGDPLWFSGSDELIPTVYTLWKHPTLLPVISTTAAVIPISSAAQTSWYLAVRLFESN